MKEFIDKLIEGLEEKKISVKSFSDVVHNNAVKICISEVNQLAEEYNEKTQHEIMLNGCDDNTVFVIDMTKQEHDFLVRVADLANETSTYGCMPRMYIDGEGE